MAIASMGLFSAADVTLDLSAGNKRRLLESLAASAAARLGRSEEEVLDALQDREQLGSTALGGGIALPHAQLRGGGRPVMLFARLARPINFQAADEEPVDLVILLLWPEDCAEGFLPALSEICRSLRDPQVLRRLRLASSPDEVVALFQREESAGSGVAPTPT
jgi:PTS system nitrogen regulatory IIA component